MSGGWPQWLRALLFVGGNLFAAATVIVVCVLPVRSAFSDRDDEIARQRDVLARLTAIHAQRDDVRRIVTSLSGLHEHLTTAKGEGAANAELQARLKVLIESSGARLRSVRSLPSQSLGPTTLMGSRFDLHGSANAIQRVLHAIDGAKPYLFVKGAFLKPMAPGSQTGKAQEPSLDVQLDVFGALRSPTTDR